MDNKKSLLQTGIDPMELAFKASLLTRFQGGWDRTRATHFQGECQAHCTSGATIYQQRVLSVIRKRDMNKSFISSERGMPTHGSSSILLHTYLLCHRVIWSQTNQKCDYTSMWYVLYVCVCPHSRVCSLSRCLRPCKLHSHFAALTRFDHQICVHNSLHLPGDNTTQNL